MASQGLLAVPSKSTKSIDFSQAFLRFIGNNYDDNPGTYREAIKEFQSLRDSTVVRSPDKHETGLDLILRCVCMHVSAYKCFQLVLIIDYRISLNDVLVNLLLIGGGRFISILPWPLIISITHYLLMIYCCKISYCMRVCVL